MSKSKPENPVRKKHSEKPQQIWHGAKSTTYNHRGGSWESSEVTEHRYDDYAYPSSRYGGLGFRIARTKK